ncbi:30S ribosomal protein S16 [Streptococcus criceti]|uniref:DUF4649 domain-containing protein n=1 Tax=Streptococcus criceti HS-6 TaxID=873449 RepID=G5JNI5_STRCG|nr:DUF4649 family protein [Streptococcus criceti]EHI75120.1 hypothetical protein STRCR_1440 [Streptococcus criceti HS-6]SUN43319.1 30S ribosomal protein S16 [Streptococcus criceti]
MIEMTFRDAYDIERQQSFENPSDFIRVLMGCSTVPEYYPVKSVTYKGKDLGFHGTYGELFPTFVDFDWSAYEGV